MTSSYPSSSTQPNTPLISDCIKTLIIPHCTENK
jgi:hypothetical protein